MAFSYPKRHKVIILALLVVALEVFARFPAVVERYYSLGLYPYLSLALRHLTGWAPFSWGDLLYAAFILYLVVALIRMVRSGTLRRRPSAWVLPIVQGVLVVYLAFQLLWGLNYSRQGISRQLALHRQEYNGAEVRQLAMLVHQRLQSLAPQVDSARRAASNQLPLQRLQGANAYRHAAVAYPFLRYKGLSIKNSMYSGIGHYIGFTGYYNPFSGEAQLKEDIPVFLKPFVVTHEMAHQLGYAKESEANFVAYLTGRRAPDPEVRYSIYFELFLYTLSELRQEDSAWANNLRARAPERVRSDMATLKAYLAATQNPVEPYISRIYDVYLRWNRQPQGRRSYNAVVAWVIAFGRKYGWQQV